MTKTFFSFLIFISLLSCKEPIIIKQQKQKLLIDYVNPFIGTTRGGNQQPGAKMPFGMVHFSPVNLGEHTPTATNYKSGEPNIFGFSLVNISGTGCSNYGGILLMPTLGKVDFNNLKSEYSDEKARPGYYRVILNNYSIKVELTATSRCGYARFTFPEGKAGVILDLSRRNSEDTSFYMTKISDNEFAGYKHDGIFCGAQGSHTIYFYSKIKNPVQKAVLVNHHKLLSPNIKKIKGEDLAFYINVKNPENNQIEIISAISYVSIENAKENLNTEIASASFDEIRQKAVINWEEKLSRIKVEGSTDKNKTKFYTALYHTMSHPNIISDVNGEYPAMKTFKTMKKEDGKNRYSVFSLWDTYRNVHPFLSLVYPEIESDMVQSLIDIYNESGWLPHWELIGIEKGVMNGDPASIVIADSYLRGIHDFNIDTAWRAMVHNAEESHFILDRDGKPNELVRDGIKYYLKYNGYIPNDYAEDVWGCVATTQEYNLADWNIAQFAKVMGENEDYEKFIIRSKGYRYFWDKETQFFRPRNADSSFLTPFNEFEHSGAKSWGYSGGPGFCEGNAWNYLFFAPHDIKNLIKIMGKDVFLKKLEMIFDNAYYQATNEPDLANPFLFNYLKDEEWRTQKVVRRLINKEYTVGTNGIPGNDDTGTMSAWLIYSMIGIYPDCPGNMEYQITSPIFDKITIKLNPKYYNGRQFVIKTVNNSVDNIYINKMKLNDKGYFKYTINHSDIVKGGELVIDLTNQKNLSEY